MENIVVSNRDGTEVKRNIHNDAQVNISGCSDASGGDKLYLAPLRNGRLLMNCPSPQLLPSRSNKNTILTNGITTYRMIHNQTRIPIGWIPLFHNREHTNRNREQSKRRNRETIILGRIDFLSSMFVACGCSKNVRSSRQKCKKCQSVLAWAGNLSRETLRVQVTDNERSRTQVSFRGSFVTVLIINNFYKAKTQEKLWGDYCDTEDNDASLACLLASGSEEEIDVNDFNMRDPQKWSNNKSIHPGATISLRYEEEKLDFLVVSEKDFGIHVVETVHPSEIDKGHSDSKGISDSKNMEDISPGHVGINDRVKIMADEQKKIKKPNTKQILQQSLSRQQGYPWLHNSVQTQTLMKSTKSNEHKNRHPLVIRIWFCLRGQDMSRKRIDLWTRRLVSFANIHDATTLGSQSPIKVQVVDSYLDATHWIISERVSDLTSVAKAIATANTNEEKLKQFLDENDVVCLKPSWLESLFSNFQSSKPSPLDPIPPPSARDLWYGYIPKVSDPEKSYYYQYHCRLCVTTVLMTFDFRFVPYIVSRIFILSPVAVARVSTITVSFPIEIIRNEKTK